jgi:putative tributyrin esterase
VPVAKRKLLYLLHGLGDDASAWQRYTSIETLAAAYGLVVVMPSVGRSFYTDQPNGQKYFTYLTGELPQYLTEVFGLAPSPENTFIAGNSMGGYGAFKAALLHPERYAAAASFSGMLSLAIFSLIPDDPRRQEFIYLFGDLDKLAGSQHDPAVWLGSAAKNPSSLPRLFIYTGRQEDIYPLSGMFHAACQSLGVQSEYFEEDGGHDWFLWDGHIRRFLASVLGPIPK